MAAESTLIKQVSETIGRLPQVALVDSASEQTLAGTPRADILIQATVQGRPVHIAIEAKRSGYPRDARAAVWQIEAYQRELGSADHDPLLIPMVIAPELSAPRREFLQQREISYCDSTGSVYIRLPWATFLIDRQASDPVSRDLRNIYHGSTAQVLHALLAEPNRPWHITELAERAGVAASTAHQVFEYLERELWVERTGKGPGVTRILLQPGALLDAWAEAHSVKEYNIQSFYRYAQTPARVRRDVCMAFEIAQFEYALTLASGAELSAPHLTSVEHLSVLLPSANSVSAISDQLGLKPVNDGGNVFLMFTKARSPLMYRRRLQDTWVASDVQLYLDLWSSPTRGKEQAQHLRRVRLGY